MKRLCLHVKGLVQGVGFRPFIYLLAQKLYLNGFVSNTSKGVHVEVEGSKESIEQFLFLLQNELPPLARIDVIEKEFIALQNSTTFTIQKSDEEEIKNSPILPDMAICDDCLSEMSDKNNRRYKYPFINCTNCGPRYSIIKAIPYDRPYTSMKKFQMCKACQDEYEDPLNRRYHAQPISCKDCGPSLTFSSPSLTCRDEKAIKNCAKLINEGKIVAVKGVGGFHLMCDGANDAPIKKLRAFKKRPLKPFALMCQNIAKTALHVKIKPQEKEVLSSIQKPIVLMQKQKESTLSPLVAPQTDRLGIFLPNTPLHVRLFEYLKNPIIATSANIKGEPIITHKEELDEKFGDIVDGILDYDRDILHPCDDSLVQIVDEKKLYLRVSRGIAPLTIPCKSSCKKNILAVGAMEKNALAFYIDGKIILSPYFGSMDSVKTFGLFEKTIDSWKKFYNIDFDVIVHDKHPSYTTTKWAKEQKKETISVNHYHAHIVATMIDQQIPLAKEVLGVAWDGTGYGDDGTIWGGEFLVCQGKEYKRVGHLKPFKLLGGEKSIKHIDRVAFSMLKDIDKVVDMSEFKQRDFLEKIHENNINAPLCSSMGRLFDAVCYLCTGLKEVSYDGQSGLILESLYDSTIKSSYPLHVKSGVIEYSEMLLQILKERTDSTLVASKFINSLAKIVFEFADTYNLPIVLGGGVFQNQTLVNLLCIKSKQEGKKLYFPQTITPNDGGICVGQIGLALIK